ncbi:MAG TPA: penicillin-binding protein 2 [Verrucomicrobiae bacterium]
MAQKVQFRRFLLLAMLICLAFAGLGYRLVDLQVLRHEELEEKARENRTREFLRQPRRGDILDAKGNLLATSVFVKTVCADPTLIGGRQPEIARAIAPLLQMPEAELHQKLLPRLRHDATGKVITNRYVVLKRKVPTETFQKIQETMAKLDFGLNEKSLPQARQTFYRNLRRYSIFADPLDDQLRIYPNHSLAAHVLGFVGMSEVEINGERALETTGVEGIERSFNSKLSGVRGWRVTETDSRRREVVPLRNQDVEPRDGLNVVLTIDSVIQHHLETALADAMRKHEPISITGIAVRPRTGEIVALATLPTFDPNQPGDVSPDARRNRVITDIMEPGSTFKIVVVSGALNDRLVDLNDQFHCENGAFGFAGHTLHDHHAYGPLSVQSIITKSSNIGAAKIGIKMGNARLYEYMRGFGFGEKTGIPLLGEMGGIVPPVEKWYKVSLAQIPMGHGIAVTRLQMVMAMCAIANGGVLMRPMLVDRLEDAEGHLVAKYSPQAVRRVISEAAAKDMIQALKTVTGPDGTAPKAAMEYYDAAGKTGTAQKPGRGGYLPGKFISSFIGFFPADDPELCISIVLDEPQRGHYGGDVAGPIFKQVAELASNYLNIRPQRVEEPGLARSLTDRTNPPAAKAVAAHKP